MGIGIFNSYCYQNFVLSNKVIMLNLILGLKKLLLVIRNSVLSGYLLRGVLTLNFWNLSTAVTFKFLLWHILKYTFLERKWATESIFGIKYHQKWWFFEKITKKSLFLAQNFCDKLTKYLWVKNAQFFGKSRKDPCLGTDFLFCNLILYFLNSWQKSAKNVFFLKKKQFFGSFFLYNSKNLWLGEKKKKKSS